MPDREKVMLALEHHKRTAVCNGCPYAGDDDTTEGYCPVYDDVIALLREQGPVKPREERHEVKISHDWGDEVEVWSEFYCPHCGAMIAKGKSEHYPRCMWCGGRVKWDADD